MATTSPDNIVTPDVGDPYSLVHDLGAMADSVQQALLRGYIPKVAGAASRDAIFPNPVHGDAVYRLDAGYVQRYYNDTSIFPATGWMPEGGDTGWITVSSLSNSFTQGSTPARYRRVGKTVYLAGGVRRDTAPDDLTAFTLSAPYRPVYSVIFTTRLDRQSEIRIRPDGTVNVLSGIATSTGDGYTIGGISYRVD